MYYLRIENDNNFGFLVEGIHNIKEMDIEIIEEDYKKFFELQNQGKQFRLKAEPTGRELFDYVEEYVPEVIVEAVEPGIEEMTLDHEYRISKLELGV